VPDDQEEPQRVFGIPIGSGRPVIVEDEEQRVLGMPVRWFEPIGRDASRSVAGLIKAGKTLLRKRRRRGGDRRGDGPVRPGMG
jgi:hypothetical protein